MKHKMILPGVNVRVGAIPVFTVLAACSTEKWQANQNEFLLEADGVGAFYVRNGNEVIYSVEEGADPDWVNLYLNGQVLVALLHQRNVISFHASSFVYDGIGVMILGESGAGKSSLAVAFALKGAELLTDDITPVFFRNSVLHIMPLHGEVRIRRHTVEELKIGSERLREAESGTGKQYLRVGRTGMEDYPLHVILKIEAGEVLHPVFKEPLLAEKFSSLRSEICMSGILAGMPVTEAEYLQQLLHIIERIRFVRVVRPTNIRITDLYHRITQYLGA